MSSRANENARVVVLCDPHDVPALWAARGLQQRGIEVDLIASSMLADALVWEHRVGAEVSVNITLADGRTLSSSAPVGVLNRLQFVPTSRLDAVGGPDRDYAVQEMQALFLSFLEALCATVVNRPSPQGLGGAWMHVSQWAALAGQAGLPFAPYRQSSANPVDGVVPAAVEVTAFVVGARVLVPPFMERAIDGFTGKAKELARLAGQSLLGIELARARSGTWQLVSASATPDLSLGGEPLIDALEEMLV